MADPTPEESALAAVRRYCGWPVTLTDDDEVTLDGPGSTLLVLPTLRLVELSGVVEDGVTLDVDTDLYVSPRGLVRKRSGACWSGHYGAITVTMTHGFDEDPLADFHAAVSSIAERFSGDAKPRVVGPFQWDTAAMADGSAFSVAEKALLDRYRLEPSP